MDWGVVVVVLVRAAGAVTGAWTHDGELITHVISP